MFEGDGSLAEEKIPAQSFAVLGEGTSVQFTAGAEKARFILVAGVPLHEPVVQYGPFVMNTQQEIHQAINDYRSGRLVKDQPVLETVGS